MGALSFGAPLALAALAALPVIWWLLRVTPPAPRRLRFFGLRFLAGLLAYLLLPRRFGTWYVTEHMVRAMRAYGWTIVVGAVGQPILYLLGLAVGLAALIRVPIVDHGSEVTYLMFVAPALLATATISALAAVHGAWGVRVHDVAATADALLVSRAWQQGSRHE